MSQGLPQSPPLTGADTPTRFGVSSARWPRVYQAGPFTISAGSSTVEQGWKIQYLNMVT